MPHFIDVPMPDPDETAKKVKKLAEVHTKWDPSARKRLEAIYDKHYQLMFTAASQLMPEALCSVEDVLQDAFMHMFPYLDRIEQMSEAGAEAYLLRIVEREAVRFLQQERMMQKNLVPLDDQCAEHIPNKVNILDTICEQETINELVQIIRNMPARYRDILDLYYISQLSLKEIAVHLHIPYDTTKKRFQRGRKLLMQRIRRKGGYYEK